MIDIKGGFAISRSSAAADPIGADMNVTEAINSRRAVREFTAEPVDEELLRQLIDAAT